MNNNESSLMNVTRNSPKYMIVRAAWELTRSLGKTVGQGALEVAGKCPTNNALRRLLSPSMRRDAQRLACLWTDHGVTDRDAASRSLARQRFMSKASLWDSYVAINTACTMALREKAEAGKVGV